MMIDQNGRKSESGDNGNERTKKTVPYAMCRIRNNDERRTETCDGRLDAKASCKDCETCNDRSV